MREDDALRLLWGCFYLMSRISIDELDAEMLQMKRTELLRCRRTIGAAIDVLQRIRDKMEA